MIPVVVFDSLELWEKLVLAGIVTICLAFAIRAYIRNRRF